MASDPDVDRPDMSNGLKLSMLINGDGKKRENERNMIWNKKY